MTLALLVTLHLHVGDNEHIHISRRPARPARPAEPEGGPLIIIIMPRPARLGWPGRPEGYLHVGPDLMAKQVRRSSRTRTHVGTDSNKQWMNIKINAQRNYVQNELQIKLNGLFSFHFGAKRFGHEINKIDNIHGISNFWVALLDMEKLENH